MLAAVDGGEFPGAPAGQSWLRGAGALRTRLARLVKLAP